MPLLIDNFNTSHGFGPPNSLKRHIYVSIEVEADPALHGDSNPIGSYNIGLLKKPYACSCSVNIVFGQRCCLTPDS